MRINILLSGLLLLFFMLCCGTGKEQKKLTLFCAAGIKAPVAKIAKAYTQLYGVDVDIQYGGSGTLLSNLRIAQYGDLYLAADPSFMDEAREYGLIAETQPLAILKPVIAVRKGNPKDIQHLHDLLHQDVSIALGNPEVASIGRLTREMLSKESLWEQIKKKTTVFKPTVNEVANDVYIGAVDACIAWDATVGHYNNLEAIQLSLFDEYMKNITIGVLNYSRQPTEALRFLRFISSLEHGNPVFNQLGYHAIQGDQWEEQPELLFFSGGVNRVAIESTIQQFEKREGANVIRVYNGCGILVSQIKSGQQPDAYLSCDLSFMTQVEERFTDISDVSRTDIIIAVKKDNPRGIQSIGDLAKEGMLVGICNPQQSALGALTKKLLEEKGLWPFILSNVRSQTPTADLLVNQLRTGSLDAVIVYRANVSQVMDKIDMVSIEDENAMALQNFGIERNSKKQWITKRLFNVLTGEASRLDYLKNGFQWEFKELE